MPTARSLAEKGDETLKAGDTKGAIDFYLRSCAVLRIARFPYISAYPTVNDETKWKAWELQKDVYARAGKLFPEPLQEVTIPHTHKAGLDRDTIPLYVRVPNNATGPVPAVLLLTGLDGYRPDNTVRCNEFLARGWAAIVAEIPGTADCPADSADPASPDRLWSSVLDWMQSDGRFDMSRLLLWGLSSGGYYAVRAAHVHRERLAGCVAQGAGVHWFFDKEWLSRADGHEYPFKLGPAMAAKHGFKSVEEYVENAQKKFSLLEAGILDQPSTRLLLINGTLDGLMPIEDSVMLFEHGTPKEARSVTESTLCHLALSYLDYIFLKYLERETLGASPPLI